mgnify:CR=1 FL=1
MIRISFQQNRLKTFPTSEPWWSMTHKQRAFIFINGRIPESTISKTQPTAIEEFFVWSVIVSSEKVWKVRKVIKNMISSLKWHVSFNDKTRIITVSHFSTLHTSILHHIIDPKRVHTSRRLLIFYLFGSSSLFLFSLSPFDNRNLLLRLLNDFLWVYLQNTMIVSDIFAKPCLNLIKVANCFKYCLSLT